MLRIDDLLITIAYFSIPVQLVFSLYQYPRLAQMPLRILVLCILFALFIFLCGAGHLMRCLGRADTSTFVALNAMTSFISMLTALYLLPLVPSLMSDFDSTLQDLVKLNQETAESKRKLFTFMAFLCHEIRNPLFAITSNIEFAQDMDMSPELDSALNSIHQSTTLMLRLVNDVLDLSKIESGKLELEEQEFDIRDFFRNVASSMKSQVQHRRHGKVDFVFNMAHNLPRFVICDSVRLLQIAYNVLSNASKFTDAGSITFSISVCDLRQAIKKGHVLARFAPPINDNDDDCADSAGGDDDDDDLEMVVKRSAQDEQSDNFSMSLLESVEEGHGDMGGYFQTVAKDSEVKVLKMQFEDTGSGIPEDRMERIFQPYSQSKLSDFRKHGGTGLGLSIIAKLTEIMGGTITVDSVVGEGSKFVVYLPIVIAKNQGSLPRRPSFAKTEEYLEHSGTEGPECRRDEMQHKPQSSMQTQQQRPSQNYQVPFPPSLISRRSSSPLPMIDPVTPSNPAPLFALDVSLQSPPSAALFHLAPTLPPPAETQNATPLFSTTTATTHASTPLFSTTITKTHDAIPLFSATTEGTNNTPTATAPLFATATSVLPSATASPVVGSIVSPGASESQVSARPKPPPLPKFHFEKTTNVVLVVDDNSINRKLIGKMLSFFNVEYDQAENGQEAVDIMGKSRNATGDPNSPLFGMVIMDLCMPVMDGYQAIATLRKRGLDLPIIALTANALVEGRQKAMDAGATEFATKPILRPVLHYKCSIYLKQTKQSVDRPASGETDRATTNCLGERYHIDEPYASRGGEAELICLI